jgi:hypothetical protein
MKALDKEKRFVRNLASLFKEEDKLTWEGCN